MSKEQERGQRALDEQGRDKSDILSSPGVSQAEEYLERGWHCHNCHLELTSIEKELYGEYCVFCVGGESKPYSLWKMVKKAYLDWKIYGLLRKFKDRYQEKSFFTIVAVLGLIGIQHIGAAYTIDLKKRVIKEIEGVLNGRVDAAGKVPDVRTGGKHNRGEETRGQEEESQEEGYADIGAGPGGHAEISRLRHQLAEKRVS